MRSRTSGWFRSLPAPVFFLWLPLLGFLVDPGHGNAQTTLPYLFAGTYDSSSNTSGFVTLLRDSTTGVLTLVPNTAVTFPDSCNPAAIDPTGSFLYGLCGEGVSMYTLDSTTGVAAETATSPYLASTTTGQSGVLVVAESTGQYVYLLKVAATQSPVASSFTLDTFSVDPATPSLVAVSSQTLSFNATFVGAVADPSRHGIFIFVNQGQGETTPAALLFSISFDPSSGLAAVPSAGLNIGDNARSIAVGPAGNYLAMGWGDTQGSVTVYQLSNTDLSLALVGTVILGLEDGSYGSYSFPDSVYFSPGNNLLYVQGPPANFAGGDSLPFLVYDPSSVTLLPTNPIQVPDASFLNGLADPQSPFTYVGNSGSSTFGISVFQVDLSTGLPSQPAAISAPFFPQMELSPLFVTVTQGSQGIQGPTLGISPDTLTFPSAIVGQTSSPQSVTLKSLGAQSVTLSSIQISGPNASDFTESDNCIASPVLLTNHTCTIAVTYAPSGTGTSQATLFVTDNAPGSPQPILLSGTSVAAPPPAPAVTLNPSSTLNFPGTPTQGTSSSPQTVTLTNSGNAPLQFFSAVLSGFDAADFSISSDTCSGSIAANATCTISLVFTPLATGIRTTTLTITDNAANSPQFVTINGSSLAAVTIVTPAGGSNTASLSAGQTAQFNLQAVAGAGFNGLLTFACSGAPFGAVCTVPSSLAVSNGAAVPFTVSVSTLGASQMAPFAHGLSSPAGPRTPFLWLALLAASWVLLLSAQLRHGLRSFPRGITAAAATAFSILLVFSGMGCGVGTGAVTSSQTAPPAQTTPTPAIQPNGGTFTAAQSVSLSDSLAGATIYYTTDGTTPTSGSPVYSSSFSLSAATTVQAMATAPGYSASTISNAAFAFRTPAATYTITVNVTATPTGSTKTLQLNPILLTLIVN
jgi:hypothetical protein